MRKLIVLTIAFSLLFLAVGMSGFGEEKAAKQITITVGGELPTLIPSVADIIAKGDLGSAFQIYRWAAFKAKYPNVTIKPVTWDMWGPQAGEALVTALAAGNAPSYYYIEMMGSVYEAIRRGMVADITEQVNKWDQKKNIPMSQWDVAWKDNRCYAIPEWGMPSTSLIWYRRDLFKAAGLKDPMTKDWTIADFVAAAKKLTDTAKGRWGVALPVDDRGMRMFNNFAYAYGAPFVVRGTTWVRPDPTQKNTFRSAVNIPPVVQALQLYHDLVFKDKSAISGVDVKWGDTLGMYFSGKTAMIWGHDRQSIGHSAAIAMFGPDYEDWPRNENGKPFSFYNASAAWPAGPQGTRLVDPMFNMYGFNPSLDKDELQAAFDFVDFMWAGRGRVAYMYWTMEGLDDASQKKLAVYPQGGGSFFKLPGVEKNEMDFAEPEVKAVVQKVQGLPACPKAVVYGIADTNGVANLERMTALLQKAVSDPNFNAQKEADAMAAAIDNDVLNYKSKDITMDDFKKYYTDMDAFYKKNFPKYYTEFKKIYDKYFKVW